MVPAPLSRLNHDLASVSRISARASACHTTSATKPTASAPITIRPYGWSANATTAPLEEASSAESFWKLINSTVQPMNA